MAEFPTEPGELAMWRVTHNPNGYGRLRSTRARWFPGYYSPLVCLKCGWRIDFPHRDDCPTRAFELEILAAQLAPLSPIP